MSIDVENQKVTVSGTVDSSTLIKRLSKSGKHAELLPLKPNNKAQAQQLQPNPNQKQHQQQKQQKPQQTHTAAKNKNNNKGQQQAKKQQGILQGLNAFRAQHNLPSISSDEDDLYDDDDDYDDDEEDVEEMRVISDKMHQINLLRQANANAKKNPNGEPKKGPAHPKAQNIPLQMAGGLGMPPSNNGRHQAMMPPPMMNMRAGGGNMGMGVGMNNNMMMHMQQPQMMYHRSPQISPYTGYYNHYYYNQAPPPPSPYSYHHQLSAQPAESSSDLSHLFSDENANSCAIM